MSVFVSLYILLTWLIASTTQTSPRVQAALCHYSSTSPGPSPVDLLPSQWDPGFCSRPWHYRARASMVCPLVSSHALSRIAWCSVCMYSLYWNSHFGHHPITHQNCTCMKILFFIHTSITSNIQSNLINSSHYLYSIILCKMNSSKNNKIIVDLHPIPKFNRLTGLLFERPRKWYFMSYATEFSFRWLPFRRSLSVEQTVSLTFVLKKSRNCSSMMYLYCISGGIRETIFGSGW